MLSPASRPRCGARPAAAHHGAAGGWTVLAAVVLFFAAAAAVQVPRNVFAKGKTVDEWRSRIIYQVLTDRFAKDDPTDSTPCNDFSSYCGGTYAGLTAKLDYLKNMGITAIWITPIVENTPGGYHGYWAQNIYELNTNFGTEQQFQTMVEEAHKRDIWIMVDVVLNHMGPNANGFDFRQYYPFDHAEHYHDCSGCFGGAHDCDIQNWDSEYQVEHCRLADLPDLDQDNIRVRKVLLDWGEWLIDKYQIDGLRIDTIPEVKKEFWHEFQLRIGTYAVGEAFMQDLQKVSYYQHDGIDAVLAYPLYYTLRSIFQQQETMKNMESLWKARPAAYFDTTVLGTFVDNHDNARFLNGQKDGDWTLFSAALGFVALAEGIPMVYYGSEQAYAGGNDPNNREPLWTAGFKEDAPIYQLLAKLHRVRNIGKLHEKDHVQRYADDQFYAFSRGDVVLACFTNVGQNGSPVTRQITFHPWSDGTTLVNQLDPNDKVVVSSGQFSVTLEKGQMKAYVKGGPL